MLTSQRRQLILDMLKQSGQVEVQTLSRAWDVSEDTIRRDLRDLAREGKLQRVHGGALAASAALADFAGRQSISADVKVELGKAAAALVHDGQIVAVDGGTSAVQMVRHLAPSLRATIVTHSPHVALELIDRASIEVILVGGKIYKHSMVSVGSRTIEDIGQVRTDLFFLGATGIHPEYGITTGDFEESLVKRAFCRNAAEVVLMASPEKLYAASAYLVVPTREISTLVVDGLTPPETTQGFEDLGISVLRTVG